MPESSDADDAMSIYSALEMTVCECALWNVPKSGDPDHAMSIYSALELTVCELCIVKCASERMVMLMMSCPFILLWK